MCAIVIYLSDRTFWHWTLSCVYGLCALYCMCVIMCNNMIWPENGPCALRIHHVSYVLTHIFSHLSFIVIFLIYYFVLLFAAAVLVISFVYSLLFSVRRQKVFEMASYHLLWQQQRQQMANTQAMAFVLLIDFYISISYELSKQFFPPLDKRIERQIKIGCE